MDTDWDLAIKIEGEQSAQSQEKTKLSKKTFKRGKQYLAGGVATGYFNGFPFPIYFKQGKGSKLEDIDGNNYLDFSMCLGALVVGHSNPIINSTIATVCQKSTILSGTAVNNIDLAQKLNELYKLSHWRFMNSGTEATRFLSI